MCEFLEPAWRTNLKDKLLTILNGVICDDYLIKILDDDSLIKYWTSAFTHKSSKFDNNNAMFIVLGSQVMNYTFTQYLRTKFRDDIDPQKITLLLNKYISAQFLSGISDHLELSQYTHYDPNQVKTNDFMIKAVFGCLDTIINDKIQMHMGYICCYNLLQVIFEDVVINLDDVKRDSISQLNEIHNQLHWKQPKYVVNESNSPQRTRYLVKIINYKGNLIGSAYDNKLNFAKFSAAEDALRKLKKKGITTETASQYKINHDQGYQNQYQTQYKYDTEAEKRYNESPKI